jgi:hypothetical protein
MDGLTGCSAAMMLWESEIVLGGLGWGWWWLSCFRCYWVSWRTRNEKEEESTCRVEGRNISSLVMCSEQDAGTRSMPCGAEVIVRRNLGRIHDVVSTITTNNCTASNSSN